MSNTTIMASPYFSFDESKFIHKFICDYYSECEFDFDKSFNEYFQNFIDSNSSEYNEYIYRKFYIKEKLKNRDLVIDNNTFLHDTLCRIVKTAMKI